MTNLPRLVPTSAEEAARLLAEAAAAGRAVSIGGLGTKRDRGGRPGRVDVELSSLALDRVLEYRPEDLTLTAEPGISLERLGAIVAERGQVLPFDPPEGGTIGGTVAAAAYGPRRLAYGAPRDSVLGLRVALTSGEVVRTGSRMVKNVAGYDLTKLLVGSMGTLGFVAEVTIKVRPRPAAARTLVHAFEDVARAIEAVRRLLASEVSPAALVLAGPLLEVALEGSAAAVAYQVDRLETLVHGLGGEPAERAARPSGPCRVRASLPIDRALDLAAALDVPWSAYAGSGIVHAFPPSDPTAIGRLRVETESRGGRLVVEEGAGGLDARARWGDPGPAFPIMARVKRTFDPHAVLAPGRFFGGL